MRFIPCTLLALLIAASGPAVALESSRDGAAVSGGLELPNMTGARVHQGNGLTLEEAVAQVRKRCKCQIVSAETKVRNGQEVHEIRILTSDGKVRTERIPGRRR